MMHGGSTELAEPDKDYEAFFARWREIHRRVHKGRTLIRSGDVPLVHSRQGLSQFYLMPQFDDVALTQWVLFMRHLSMPSGRHRHQGGIGLFILDGPGHTIVNGQRVGWEKHDVVYLPIVPGGLDHQHFSDSVQGDARFIGIIYEPLIAGMGAELSQLNADEAEELTPALVSRRNASGNGESVTSWPDVAPTLAGLIAVREHQREALQLPPVIRARDLERDETEFGLLRWYLHPAKPGFAGTAPYLLFTQSLEAGDRSRTLSSPGNGFAFVLAGSPIIRMNDEAFECAADDLVCLPARTDGVRLSVEAGGQSSLVLIALANLAGLGGVAMGSEFGLT